LASPSGGTAALGPVVGEAYALQAHFPDMSPNRRQQPTIAATSNLRT